MTPQAKSGTKPKILKPAEVTVCEGLAKLNIKLISQRAKALLLINEGNTQALAAEGSGLSIGQVRYLMIIFRKNGLKIFPEELLTNLKKKTPPAAPAKKETKTETKVTTKPKAKKEKAPVKKKEEKKKKKTKKQEPKKKKEQKVKKVKKSKEKSKKKKKK